jgi:nucleotidyltransferase substrate binding protein (TIGR01987 family)
MENKLDLTALRKAAQAFGNALAFAANVEKKTEGEIGFYELETARASVIQHFEFCYELCWKTMKRFIEMDIGSQADLLTRKDLFRLSAEKALIADFDQWVVYHMARNRISHVYEEEAAAEIYQIAKTFAQDMQTFLKTMEERA